MLPTYDFTEQLEKSKVTVARLAEWLRKRPGIVTVLDVQDIESAHYKGDLLLDTIDGLGYMEVKCHRRRAADTELVAIERYSNIYVGSSGGPWSTNARWFANLYSDGFLIVCDRRELIALLAATRTQHQTFQVSHTFGLLVSRAFLRQHLGASYWTAHTAIRTP